MIELRWAQALLLTLVALLASPSLAAEPWGLPADANPDISPDGCGSWLSARSDPVDRSIELLMASGYLGAVVMYSGLTNQTLISSDAKTIGPWLDKFCFRHPNDKVEIGISALALRMSKKSLIK